MSPDQQRAFACRLILAASIGLAVEILRGAFLPPLPAVIAIQVLAGSPAAPPLKAAIVLLLTATAACLVAYSVSVLSAGSGMAGGTAGGVAGGVALAVLYLWAFVICFIPALAALGTMALTMLIVVSSVANTSDGAALLVISEIVAAVIQGFVLVYLSHAVFAHRQSATEPSSESPLQTAAETAPLPIVMRASLATAIILPAHLYLNTDGVAAMVVLLTMAAMLREPTLTRSTGHATGFAAGNAIGAVIAACSVFVTARHDEPLLTVAVIVAAAAFFAVRIAAQDAWSRVFVPGFIAYAMLFGLVFSTAPLGDTVSVVSRVVQIVAAALYVIAAASLLIPLARRRNPSQAGP